MSQLNPSRPGERGTVLGSVAVSVLAMSLAQVLPLPLRWGASGLMAGALALLAAKLGLAWLGERERARALERAAQQHPIADGSAGSQRSTDAVQATGKQADVAQLVRNLTPQVQRMAGSEAIVSIEVAPDLPVVCVDENGLQQAILGLCAVAVATMADGERLALQLQVDRDDPAPQGALTLQVDAGAWRVGALRWPLSPARPD